MKNQFEEPIICVDEFEVENIITTSLKDDTTKEDQI